MLETRKYAYKTHTQALLWVGGAMVAGGGFGIWKIVGLPQYPLAWVVFPACVLFGIGLIASFFATRNAPQYIELTDREMRIPAPFAFASGKMKSIPLRELDRMDGRYDGVSGQLEMVVFITRDDKKTGVSRRAFASDDEFFDLLERLPLSYRDPNE